MAVMAIPFMLWVFSFIHSCQRKSCQCVIRCFYTLCVILCVASKRGRTIRTYVTKEEYFIIILIFVLKFTVPPLINFKLCSAFTYKILSCEMSGHKYISNTSNLFGDDDVDDDTFVNSYTGRRPAPQPKPTPQYGGHVGDMERQRQVMLQRQREIEQRTLDSSTRTIGLLRESEEIGIATAEELMRQGEQLHNVNHKLDEINTNLNTSQKHLNGIKSVFYGLKNYISGKSDPAPPKTQSSPDTRNMNNRPSGSRLADTVNNFPETIPESTYASHPSTRLRGLDQTEPISDSQRVNEMLDANLDEMVHAIQRLKGLGSELGREIDTQNELIDNIQDKVESSDLKIGKQNKQMNKLLGK